jgi:hypothetical protein
VLREEGNVNAADAFHNPRPLAGHQQFDGLAAALDDCGVLLVERDAYTPHASCSRDRAVTQIHRQDVAVSSNRKRGEVVVHAATSFALEPAPDLRSASPIPHSCARDAELARDCAVVDAVCDEALRSVELFRQIA